MATGNDQKIEPDQLTTSYEENVNRKNSSMQKLVHAVRVWWRHHPANLALEIAHPALQQYASKKPYQLIGIATVIGVAVVFIRPWRLVSITGLLLATVKSSGVANMALSLLSSHFKSYNSERPANPS